MRAKIDLQEEWEFRRYRTYGPAKLSRGTRIVMWLLRAYVFTMATLIVASFVHQLRG